MKISKYDLCDSCRKIRPRMDDGSLGPSIEDLLEGPGYAHPTGYTMLNHAILLYLQEDGGCPGCISLAKRATA